MAVFNVRLSDDLAERFDAAATLEGGRSALLRRLIAGAAGAAQSAPSRPAATDLRDGARIMVRLDWADAARVDAEAAAMELTRAGWVAALVRRRVRGRPQFSRADELALFSIRADLRRIGVNLNQIARGLNGGAFDGQPVGAALQRVGAFQDDLRRHADGLRAALAGNLAYWEAER